VSIVTQYWLIATATVKLLLLLFTQTPQIICYARTLNTAPWTLKTPLKIFYFLKTTYLTKYPPKIWTFATKEQLTSWKII